MQVSFCIIKNYIFLNLYPAFWSSGCRRLQNSEQECKQSDQSDKDMRVELEGKVDALQKQLTDLDTLRLRDTQFGKKE